MEKKGERRVRGGGKKCLGSVLYDDYSSNNGSGLVFIWKRAGGLRSVICNDVLTTRPVFVFIREKERL
jgi:hypothetical protein